MQGATEVLIMRQTTQVILTIPLLTNSDAKLSLDKAETVRLSRSAPSIWAETPSNPHVPIVCGCESYQDAQAWRFAALVSIASAVFILTLFLYSITL